MTTPITTTAPTAIATRFPTALPAIDIRSTGAASGASMRRTPAGVGVVVTADAWGARGGSLDAGAGAAPVAGAGAVVASLDWVGCLVKPVPR
jgi:hypothetical protein